MSQNYFTGKEYVLESFFWAVVALAVYNTLLFSRLAGWSDLASNILLLFLLITGIIINTLATVKWSRNRLSAACSPIIPLGCFTYAAYMESMPYLFSFLCVTAVGVSLFFLGAVIAKDTRGRTRKARTKTKARRAYLIMRWIWTVASVLLMFCALSAGFAAEPAPEGGFSEQEYAYDYSIDGNMDKIQLLSDEEWKKLGSDERMELVRLIARVESVSNLGFLDEKLKVEISYTLPESVLGQFNPSENAIYLAPRLLLLDDSRDLIRVLFHELAHVAQIRYVTIYDAMPDEYKQLYYFRDAAVYSEEFSDYKSAANSEDTVQSTYDEYAKQKCERDARVYGITRANYLYIKILEYLCPGVDLTEFAFFRCGNTMRSWGANPWPGES